MYPLQHYKRIKNYLKTCKYISWFINTLTCSVVILFIYTTIINLPLYSCYQEAKLLGHDLDIITMTEEGCGTIIKDKFILLKDL